MKKGWTELVFLLDRSGSMGGLESDTIGGFNSLIAKQRKEEGDAVVTTVLFDDKYELLHDRFILEQVHNITEHEYYVRGCTALLDAIGKTITKIAHVQKLMDKEDRAEHVIFIITTDGLENASKEYSYETIRQMIELQKSEYHWEFIFLGANMDAVTEAKRFGINEDRAVTYQCDSEGIATNYKILSKTVSSMRSRSAKEQPIGAEWKKEIEKDYNRKRDKSNCSIQ